MNIEPSVNQRKVRLQRRTELVVNDSQRGVAKKAIEIDMLACSLRLYNRGSYAAVLPD